jgi:hypothetical protein
MAKGMIVIFTFTITMVVKQRRLKWIECTNKGDELHDVSTYYMMFLKFMTPLDTKLKVFANPIVIKV